MNFEDFAYFFSRFPCSYRSHGLEFVVVFSVLRLIVKNREERTGLILGGFEISRLIVEIGLNESGSCAF